MNIDLLFLLIFISYLLLRIQHGVTSSRKIVPSRISIQGYVVQAFRFQETRQQSHDRRPHAKSERFHQNVC